MTCTDDRRPNPRLTKTTPPATSVRSRLLWATEHDSGNVWDHAVADRDQLIHSCLDAVYDQAFNFLHANSGLNLDDLVSAGLEGLLQAAELYDPESGCRFNTYAHWAIRSRMIFDAKQQHRACRVPRTTPGDASLLDEKARWRLAVVTNPLSTSYRDCHGNLVLDVPTPKSAASLEVDEVHCIHEALKTLPPRWRSAVYFRYWDGLTLRQVAARLGVSHERARQMLLAALQRLKKYLARTFAPTREEGSSPWPDH